MLEIIIYLNQLPLFSELSASEPRRLVRPRLSSSFLRNLRMMRVSGDTSLELHAQETPYSTARLFIFSTNTTETFSLSYLFLEPFLFCSSALSSSSSSQWSVSPSRMGGMETLRTQPGLNTHRW